MTRILVTILLVSTLFGCCSSPIIAQEAKIQVDPRILEPCRPQVHPVGELTWDTLLENTRDNSLIYKECKLKNDSAILFIKKLTNQ